jgi:hypothetical protein
MKTNLLIPFGKACIVFAFDEPIHWNTLPTFMLRSILGSQLKHICCVQRQLACENCAIAPSCAYAVLFESPIPKNTEVLPGRNRGAHPFVLTHEAVMENGRQYACSLTLIGVALQFFPFMVLAFQKAGEEGIFSDKIHFSLAQLTDAANGKKLSTPVLSPLTVQKFCLDTSMPPSAEPIAQRAKIEFLTPARIKDRGCYTLDFDAYALLYGMYRRIEILAALYASEPDEPSTEEVVQDMPNSQSHSKKTNPEYRPPKELTIAQRQLVWKDFSRYSQRQKAAMELGGALGWIELEGPLRSIEKSLLEAGSIFHIGKNTAFGLGAMRVEWSQ